MTKQYQRDAERIFDSVCQDKNSPVAPLVEEGVPVDLAFDIWKGCIQAGFGHEGARSVMVEAAAHIRNQRRLG